jgi:peptidoglycan/LPS O-acetylase OafA/YrhL
VGAHVKDVALPERLKMGNAYKNQTSTKARLDQLTSLRFFAAYLIILYHSVGLFGIERIGVNLGQGVSFFFVLSGFILTYVYPRLDSWTDIRQFWRARFARIWPAYIT